VKDFSKNIIFNNELERDRVALLYRNNSVTQASGILIASFYFLLFREVVPSEILWPWYLAVCFVQSIRIAYAVHFIKNRIDGNFDPRRMEMLFVAGVFLSALLWSLVGSVMLPKESFAHQALTGFILAGLTAGASAAYSSSMKSSILFILGAIVPFCLTELVWGGELQYGMAGMGFCYLGFYGVFMKKFHDVTLSTIGLGHERKKLISELETQIKGVKASEQRLTEVQNIAHIGHFEMNLEQNEGFWSDEVYRIFEIKPGEVEPRWNSFLQVMPEELRESVDLKLQISLATGEAYEEDLRIKTKAGVMKYIFVRTIPQSDQIGDSKTVRGIVFDISQRKKAELAVAQSSKMSALGEMAGGLAHEINSPLAILVMSADALKRRLSSDPNVDEKSIHYLERMRATTFRIAKLVKNLQAFSTDSSSLELESVQLSGLIQTTLELCHEKLKTQGIRVVTNVEEDTYLVCNSSSISQALFNLISNSADAVRDQLEKWILINVLDTQDFVVLSVTDSGPGIPENIKDKVMQPFFTTKEVGDGQGLGLSVAKGLIEAHGGKIQLDQSSGNTCFVLSLPKNQVQSRSAA
jgi:PAS domain S-box-containing protein